jgi:uncharacterized protein YkwD
MARGTVSRIVRIACLATAATAAIGMAAAPASADCPDADLQADETTVDRVRGALLCVINERRAAAGRQPLAASPPLERSAAAHSRDMVAHHYLAHEQDGRPTLLTRVRKGGYLDGTATALFSENIGVAPIGGATARKLVDAWLTSAAHRANIMHPMFADLGVGTAFAPPDEAFYPSDSALVVTTDFGQRVMLRTPAGRRIARRCRARRRAVARGDGSATTRARVCPRRRAR